MSVHPELLRQRGLRGARAARRGRRHRPVILSRRRGPRGRWRHLDPHLRFRRAHRRLGFRGRSSGRRRGLLLRRRRVRGAKRGGPALALRDRLRLFALVAEVEVELGIGVVYDGTRTTVSVPKLACNQGDERTAASEHSTTHEAVYKRRPATHRTSRTATCRPAGPCASRLRCPRGSRSSSSATRRRSYSRAVRPRTPSPSPRARAPWRASP